MNFSVIVPTYNEENIIRHQIHRIRDVIDAEIIVVDGGSTDKTREILREEDVLLISSRKGRGIQLDEGYKNASNDLLIFLHADTKLPPHSFDTLSKFFQDERKKIGAFTIKFDPSNLILDLITYASKFDSVLTSFGDQCIFLRKDFYEQIGGFPAWPIFEDVYLLKKARKKTKVHKIKGPVISSSRRFQKKGVLLQLALNSWLMLLYHLGVDPKDLVKRYEK